ncbi:Uncharacterised protein [Shigella sonnei]|nr:Uncharacterised protein [Shigella sonnei]SJK81054.1 Uncharacterised protein [Shigella sonnei]
MLTQTIFPCLPKKNKKISSLKYQILYYYLLLLLQMDILFLIKKQPYTNCKYLLPTERKG